MRIARIIKLEAGFLWAFAVIIALKDKDNGWQGLTKKGFPCLTSKDDPT